MANEKARSLLESVFGHADLYLVLQVPSEASAEEIKRAYRKLALKHHPDRGGSKETFQALSLVYSLLSDEEKRRIYDETGSLEDADDDIGAGDNEESFAFWNDYFRALFPSLTTQKIDDFARTYIGSEEERKDVLERYTQFQGDLPSVMECVMFAEEGDERRICAIIDAAIAKEEVLRYPRYEETRVSSGDNDNNNDNKKKKSKRGRKRAIKHFDCEDDDNDDNEDGEEDNEDKDSGDDENEAKKSKKKAQPSKKKPAKKKESEGDMDALVAAIRGKRDSRSASLWQSVLSRYGEGEGAAEEPLIDDEAFERARPQRRESAAKKNSDKPAKAMKTNKPRKK